MTLTEWLFVGGPVRPLPTEIAAPPSSLAYVDALAALLVAPRDKASPTNADSQAVRDRLAEAFPETKDPSVLRALAARLLAGIHGLGVPKYEEKPSAWAKCWWRIIAAATYQGDLDFPIDNHDADGIYRHLQENTKGEQRLWFPVVDAQHSTANPTLVKMFVSRVDVPSDGSIIRVAPWCMYQPDPDIVAGYATFVQNLPKDETIWEKGTTILLDFRMDQRDETTHFEGASFGTALVLGLLAIREKQLLSTIVATGALDDENRLNEVAGVDGKALATALFNIDLARFAGQHAVFVIPAQNQRDVPATLQERVVTVPVAIWQDQRALLTQERRLFDPFRPYREALVYDADDVHPEEVGSTILATLNFDDPPPTQPMQEEFDAYARRYKAGLATYNRAPLFWYLDTPKQGLYAFRTLAATLAAEALAPLDGELLELALRYYPDTLRLFIYTPKSTIAPLFDDQEKWLKPIIGDKVQPNPRVRFLASDLYHSEFLRDLTGEELWYVYQAKQPQRKP